MKTPLFAYNYAKPLLVAIGLSFYSLFASADNSATLKTAQPERSSDKQASRYNLEILDGKLLLNNLRDRVDINSTFGSGTLSTIPATLSNVVTVLRELHTEANIVMEPSLGTLTIGDLKIRSTHGDEEIQLREELLALTVASGSRFHWEQPSESSGIDPLTGQPTKHSTSSLYVLSIDPVAAANKARRQVEVFNISGYIHSENEDELNDKLARIKHIINDTTQRVQSEDENHADATTFEYHRGANLLIVVGSPESIEIARKVVNALLMQPEAPNSEASAAGQNPFMMDPRMMERYFGVKIQQPKGTDKTPAKGATGADPTRSNTGATPKP